MFFIHICFCLNGPIHTLIPHFSMCLLWINPTFHPPNDAFSTSFPPDGAVGMEELSTLEPETLKDVMSAVQQLDLKMKN